MERTMRTMYGTFGDAVRRTAVRAGLAVRRARAEALRACDEESAQGTTEYAILVGVLVVIAILAIVAFRDNLSELWDDITDGINSL